MKMPGAYLNARVLRSLVRWRIRLLILKRSRPLEGQRELSDYFTDRIFVAGHRGMAGSAISRAFERAGYHQLLTASRSELDLLDRSAAEAWFDKHQPTVVVLAAAKVGGIQANSSYPGDFLLENLNIQTHVIETAWRSGVRRLMFWAAAASTQNSLISRSGKSRFLLDRWNPLMSGTRSPRSLASSFAKHCANSTALMQ